jgi:HAE1 family hydrophobic/amphiphilic exporter-1
MIIGLRNSKISNMDELRKVAVNYIRNELVRLEGIADITITGDEEEEIVVETNNYLLESFGLTSDVIATRISAYNRNVSGGSIVDMGIRYTVKGITALSDIHDLENIIVGFIQPSSSASSAAPVPSASQFSPSSAESSVPSASARVPVYLKDVAIIRKGNKEPDNIVTINGERCIGLSVFKEPEYNTVDAVGSLIEELENLEKALPGYDFIIIQDQGKYIHNAINEVKNTLITGIILAIIVLYIFLRRAGTTLVISIAIPVSIIATFNLMYFSNLTLNIMTLGGLALGAGMLVDNAIVVTGKHYQTKRGRDASKRGSYKRDRPGGRSYCCLDINNHCGISSNRLPAGSIRRNVQRPGLDSCLCTYFLLFCSNACYPHAGINHFLRQKQKNWYLLFCPFQGV